MPEGEKDDYKLFDQQELITEYDKEDRNVAFERQMIELLNSSRISEQPGVTLEEAKKCCNYNEPNKIQIECLI